MVQLGLIMQLAPASTKSCLLAMLDALHTHYAKTYAGIIN